jgi:hypothetical protein
MQGIEYRGGLTMSRTDEEFDEVEQAFNNTIMNLLNDGVSLMSIATVMITMERQLIDRLMTGPVITTIERQLLDMLRQKGEALLKGKTPWVD